MTWYDYILTGVNLGITALFSRLIWQSLKEIFGGRKKELEARNKRITELKKLLYEGCEIANGDGSRFIVLTKGKDAVRVVPTQLILPADHPVRKSNPEGARALECTVSFPLTWDELLDGHCELCSDSVEAALKDAGCNP